MVNHKLPIAHVIWGAKDQGQNSNLSALVRTTSVDQISAQLKDLHFSLLTVQRMQFYLESPAI